MKAIGYARCSTMEQADSGLGITAQVERIRAYCQIRELDMLRIVLDEGVSGGKPLASRPGGRELLNAIRTQKAGAVVMLKLDRGFRNAGDCLAVVDQWERGGIALHVIDLGGNSIDSKSAAGRFMLTVLAGAAEMERNLTRERTRSALGVKRAAGERISGRIPFGFDLAADGVNLTSNGGEQAIVAEIRTLRRCGLSYGKIARRLNDQGVPTKRGARWFGQTIRQISKRERPTALEANPAS